MVRSATRPLEELATLDRLIHEPARLAILTALSACRSAEFPFLARATGLTHGNLSSHLAKLEDGGLVSSEKAFRGRTPATTIRITQHGRSAVDEHWQRLAELRARSVRYVTEATSEGTS